MAERPMTRRITRSTIAAALEPAPAHVQVKPPQHQRVVKHYDKTRSFTETFGGRLAWKIRHCGAHPATSTPVMTGKEPKAVLQKSSRTKKPPATHNVSEESNVTLLSPIPKPDVLTRLLLDPEPPPSQSVPAKSRRPLQSTDNDASQIPRLPLTTDTEKEMDLKVDQHPLNFSELLDRYGEPDENKKENGNELRVHFEPLKVKTYIAKVQPNKPVAVETRRKRKSAVKSSAGSVSKTKPKASKNKESTVKTTMSKRKGTRLNPEAVDWIQKTNREFEDVMTFDLCVEKR